MKKFLSFLLCLTLVVSMFMVDSFAAEKSGSLENFKKVNSYTQGEFSDITGNEWYASKVASAYELGLMSGTGSKFNPSGNITVAESIVLACRLHSVYYNDGEDFVQSTPWYKTYVDYALNNGIISKSYSDYSQVATRSEFAVIIYSALPSEAFKSISDIKDGDIPDVPSSSDYAPAVYALYRAGILSGSDAYGTFKPKTAITRGAIATIVTNIADDSLRKSVVLKKAVSSITLSSTSLALTTGNTATLSANVLPSDATDQTVSWLSSNTKVATVNNGVVTGIGAGTATITATSSTGISSQRCTVTVIKALPISAPYSDEVFGFCFAINSADGIKLCWRATNNSGKTINYYTVRVHFYNAVGDPAYDEITGACYRDIKVVGPVAPGNSLVIFNIVGYVPACSKVVLGNVTLQYSDGKTEAFWYGYNTTRQNQSIL